MAGGAGYQYLKAKGYEVYADAKERDNLRTKYKLTLEERDAMIDKQDGRCAICSTEVTAERKAKNKAHVDHCHDTGIIRGILCNKCNTGLGYFGDTLEGIKKAYEYMEKAYETTTDNG